MQVSLKRAPVQSDFARLLHYTPRIQHVPQTAGLIAPDLIYAPASHSPDGIILPNIRTLHYDCSRFPSTGSGARRMLFSPKLCSVHHRCSVDPPADTATLGCMRTLPLICPALSELHFSTTRGSTPSFVHAMSESICGFQDLTSISVDGIALDLPAILHLGTLSNLTDLRASPSDDIAVADFQPSALPPPSGRGQAYFRSLRTIDIGNRLLARCTHFQSLISSPVLDSVSVQNFVDPGLHSTADDVSDVCLELGRHPSPPSARCAPVHTSAPRRSRPSSRSPASAFWSSISPIRPTSTTRSSPTWPRRGPTSSASSSASSACRHQIPPRSAPGQRWPASPLHPALPQAARAGRARARGHGTHPPRRLLAEWKRKWKHGSLPEGRAGQSARPGHHGRVPVRPLPRAEARADGNGSQSGRRSG